MGKTAKICILLWALVKSFPAMPQATDDLPLDNGLKTQSRPESRLGVAPVLAYTPTYRLITGFGLFVFPKEGRGGLDSHLLLVALPNSGNLHASFSRADIWNAHWGYNLSGVYTTFISAYYGEGDDTPPNSSRYNQRYLRLHEGITYNLNRENYLEAFVETRDRKDLGLVTNSDQHLAPNENRSAVGVAMTHDSRDSLVNTRRGTYANAQVQGVFGDAQAPGFTQIELEIRHFIPMPDRFALGLRSELSASSNRATYNYRYNLGGLERLRGFLHNRFRGDQYYLAGGELRKDVWKDYVQLVTFIDAGDIRDQAYVRPRVAYGVGIRCGLPPDWEMKFRVDFAKGDDQSGVFASFGQAF